MCAGSGLRPAEVRLGMPGSGGCGPAGLVGRRRKPGAAGGQRAETRSCPWEQALLSATPCAHRRFKPEVDVIGAGVGETHAVRTRGCF